MMLTGIQSNLSSLNTQSRLALTQSSLERGTQRLTSGARINSASDDAAGLSISTRMRAQVHGVSKAIGNANDAISLSQTADGALTELTSLLQRMRELAVQAASETNNRADRQALQSEVDQLKREIDQVGQLQFNGRQLFGGNYHFQLGASWSDEIDLNLSIPQVVSDRLGVHSRRTLDEVSMTALETGDLMIVHRDGTTTAVRATSEGDDQLSTLHKERSAIAKAAAINASSALHGVKAYVGETRLTSTGIDASQVLDEDDVLTINGVQITGLTVEQNDADGALVNAINVSSEKTGVVASLNSAGALQLVAKDGRNIAIGATGSATQLGFEDGDVQGGHLTLESEDTYQIKFASEAAQRAIGLKPTSALAGLNHTVGTITWNSPPSFTPGNAMLDSEVLSISGTYTETGSDGDFSGKTFYGIWDGGHFFVYTGTDAHATFTIVDYDHGAVAAESATLTVNGTSFTISYDSSNIDDVFTHGPSGDESTGIRFTLTPGPLGGDSNPASSLEVIMGKSFKRSTVSTVDLMSTSAAEESLRTIDSALAQLGDTQAKLGALVSRLDYSIENLNQAREDITISQSRITDADFAQETAEVSKAQILQQAGVSVLAQASSAPRMLLSLLGAL